MVAPGRKRCGVCGVEYSCDPYTGHACRVEDIAKVFEERIEARIDLLRTELVRRIAEEVSRLHAQHHGHLRKARTEWRCVASRKGEPVIVRHLRLIATEQNLCDGCAHSEACEVPDGPSRAPDATIACGQYEPKGGAL